MSRMRMALLAACGAALVFAAPAAADRPKPGAHYFGFPAEATEDENFVQATGELRVSRSGRRVAPAKLAFYCGRNEYEVQVRLFGSAGRRSAVRVRRDGSFAALGRGGARLSRPAPIGSYRLRGRFVSRDVARIAYTERRPVSRRLVCRARMKLYRNGVPPYSGCRSQRAGTDLWGSTGRVFQQFRLYRNGGQFGFGEFFTHHYACLFESPSKRTHLGRNYDDERRETFRIAGPFVAFFTGGCGNCIRPQWWVEVRDVRDGRLVSRPSGRSYTGLVDLALKPNGSLAWTLERFALRPDGYPIGYGTTPPVVETREAWALDNQGQRLLDSGPELVPESLELNDSTLTWTHAGSTRSATLD